MTETDNTGLSAEQIAMAKRLGSQLSAWDAGYAAGLKAQRREIEELRRELAKRTELQLQAITDALARALRAEDELTKMRRTHIRMAVAPHEMSSGGQIWKEPK